MELIVSQAEFSRALTACGRAVPSRASHPILTNVLLKAEEGSLILTGFDLNLGIETRILAQVSKPGSTAVNYKLLHEIVSKLPSDSPVSLSLEEERFTISSLSGNYELSASDPIDFPDFPVIQGDSILLPAAELNKITSRVSFCCSTDEAKQILMGVNIKTIGNTIRCAATDGHRLGVAAFAVPSDKINALADLDLTIPIAPMKEIAGLSDEEISITPSKFRDQLIIKSGATTITTRSFAGAYPNVEQLIPKSFTTSVIIDRKAFALSLGRVGTIAAMASNGSNAARIAFNDEQGMMSIRADADGGKASEQLAMDLEGKPLEIAFNVKYLIDAVKALKCERIVLSCNTPVTPAVITDPDSDDNLSTYLIMPIQVKQ